MCSEMWHMIQFNWSFSINHNMTGHKRLKMAHHNLFYVKMYSFFLFFCFLFFLKWLTKKRTDKYKSVAGSHFIQGSRLSCLALTVTLYRYKGYKKGSNINRHKSLFLLFYMRFVSLVWAIHKLLLYFSLKNNSNIL